ncbi:MAG: hypothetical protein P5681_26660, partial [Limnospira sp. PMC 894.15]|nr:hypothetical protein [Limnospira sp. PMC 894.15]
GTIDREEAIWLRFYDTEGNLVLLPEEAERQKAEQAQQLAETERQKAEAAEQRAESAEQRAELLAQRLRALGLDPEEL